jgi:hypothetical protein
MFCLTLQYLFQMCKSLNEDDYKDVDNRKTQIKSSFPSVEK